MNRRGPSVWRRRVGLRRELNVGWTKRDRQAVSRQIPNGTTWNVTRGFELEEPSGGLGGGPGDHR